MNILIILTSLLVINSINTEEYYLIKINDEAVQTLKRLEENGADREIEKIKIQGVPLLVALSTRGINRTYLKRYKRLAGEEHITDSGINFLCTNSLFDEAIFFITNHYKSSNSNILHSCIRAAVSQYNSEVVQRFLFINGLHYDENFINNLDKELEQKVQMLESFIK